jgi:hypothetical protein
MVCPFPRFHVTRLICVAHVAILQVSERSSDGHGLESNDVNFA